MTAAAPSVLALEDVALEIDGTRILDAITWRVAPGQRWVIVGGNGAGKTSLLRIAALYQHPSRGRVDVLGERLGRCDVRMLRTRIALSSPAMAASLEPRMTATEVVMTARFAALAPWWHTYEQADVERARDLLVRFGVGHVADHRFHTLSAGERQRTLLARTRMNPPGLVLLDEPTAGLDIGAREQVLGDLARLAADPAEPPSVVVTHHLEEIPPGTTHALVLRQGRALAQGPIAETLNDAVLSECFGVGLRITQREGRFAARLA